MPKGQKLSLGFILTCLLIAPVYVFSLLGIPLALVYALFSGSQQNLYSAIDFSVAAILLTMLIAGLYRQKRLVIVVFVLLFPLYVGFGVPTLIDNKFNYFTIGPLLVICGLTLLAGGVYAWELGLIRRGNA